MRLYIAEKPDIAKAIAEHLGGSWKKEKTQFTKGNETISWCYGHILGMAMPEDYKDEWKDWKIEHYPILPEAWKMMPRGDTKAHLKALVGLIKKADEIVHAGDPDREGQLLVDEVLEYAGYKGPVKRVLINAKDEKSMTRAFSKLEDNKNYRGLYSSGLGRARADWLIGMNGTRLYTVLGRKAGFNWTAKIGRVKTPTLALVVNREKEIQDFKVTDYFDFKVTLDAGNSALTGTRVFETYLTDPNLAKQMEADLKSAGKGEITAFDIKEKKEVAPLPFSLDTLQFECNKKFGWSPDETLKYTQELYEAKFVSYPRSDCNFLPTGQKEDAIEIIASLKGILDESVLNNADLNLTGRCWNDAKITAHHAIIPTGVHPHFEKNKENLEKLYKVIAERYILQFYGPYVYDECSYTFSVGKEEFKGKIRSVKLDGWHFSSGNDENDDNNEVNTTKTLPNVSIGNSYPISDIKQEAKATKPPKRFTEGTLLNAMTHIYRFVDPAKKELREKLKEIKGIGTPATRASIIKDLIDDGYAEKKGKMLVPTTAGTVLIGFLPQSIQLPDKTAELELMLKDVEDGRTPLNDYISQILSFLGELKDHSKTKNWTIMNDDLQECPVCHEGKLQLKNWKGIKFWGCTRYKEGCKTSFDDVKGKPFIKVCPECGKGFLKRKKGKKGFFWGCSNYTNGCRYSTDDKNGMPVGS